MEHGYRDEQPHYNAKPTVGSVEEQLETIQDDVNLLKIEIKQTLVDLREFILNSQTGFLPRTNVAQPSPGLAGDDQSQPGPGRSQGSVAGREGASRLGSSLRQNAPSAPDQEPPPQMRHPEHSGGQAGRGSFQEPREELREEAPGARATNGGAHSPAESFRRPPEPVNGPMNMEGLDEARKIGEMDVEMLAKLLVWLDSIKGKGISPQQVRPFLQAYEARGTLTATMSTIILQSIRAISLKAGNGGDSALSSQEYLGILQQLHDIVCGANSGSLPSSSAPAVGIRRVKAGPETQA